MKPQSVVAESKGSGHTLSMHSKRSLLATFADPFTRYKRAVIHQQTRQNYQNTALSQ